MKSQTFDPVLSYDNLKSGHYLFTHVQHRSHASAKLENHTCLQVTDRGATTCVRSGAAPVIDAVSPLFQPAAGLCVNAAGKG